MKRILLFILFLSIWFSSPILSQSDCDSRINHRDFKIEKMKHCSIGIEQMKTSLNKFINQNKEPNSLLNKDSLDNRFLLMEKIYHVWKDSNWVNYGIGSSSYPYGGAQTYLYNENNNMIEMLWSDWDGLNWVNFRKYTYNYDANKNVIEYLESDWDGLNWVNFSKNTYTYNANNNMIEDLWSNWDGLNWVHRGKNTYTYDTNNNMIEELFQSWDNRFVGRLICTYDANNNMIEGLDQSLEDSNWVNNFKYKYTYDANNNMIETLRQECDGSVLENDSKNTYAYDANNNMIEDLRSDWDGLNWVNDWIYIHTYDANNNMIKELVQNWDNSVWVNMGRFIYTYVPLTGIELFTNGVIKYKLSNNYPNPFNPSTTIKYSIPRQRYVSLKVFDLLGSEVATLVNKEQSQGSYEVEFDGKDKTSGIYIYRLQAGDFVTTRKMILLK